MDTSTYGLSVLLLAQLTGVHMDTARRWKRNGQIPPHHAQIIELKLNGDLGALTASWRGFRIADGKLWTPEGAQVTPGEIRAIPLRRQQLADLQRQLMTPTQKELF